MFPASVSGIVNGEAPVSYWPIFLTLATVPEAFAKVNSAQFSFLIKLHVKLIGVVSNCIMGVYWGHCRFFHWLLRGCGGNWLKICPPKPDPY